MNAPRVQPVGLVGLRDELSRWSDGAGGAAATSGVGVPQWVLRNAFALADLFHVSADMTSLAVEAGATLPSFEIERGDLPSDHGFLVYEEGAGQFVQPMWAITAEGEKIPRDKIVTQRAVAWTTGNRTDAPYDVLLSLFVDPWKTMAAREPGLPIPPLLPYGWVGLRYDTPDFVHAGEAEVQIGDHVRTFLAACLLMSQPGVGSSRVYEPTKLDRAMFKRRRIPPRPVRVIHLRHVSNPCPNPSAEQRAYHHRWVVRGHWRQQPCGPGRVERRPVWITPHIKGPEGAPLLTGEKVYAWVR